MLPRRFVVSNSDAWFSSGDDDREMFLLLLLCSSVGGSVSSTNQMDDVYLPKKMSHRIHLIIKNLLPHLHYNNRGFLPTKDFERENILRKGIMMETNSLCRGRKKYLHEKRTGKHRLCCLDFFLREKGRERVCLTKGSNLQVVSLGGGATKFLLFI